MGLHGRDLLVALPQMSGQAFPSPVRTGCWAKPDGATHADPRFLPCMVAMGILEVFCFFPCNLTIK